MWQVLWKLGLISFFQCTIYVYFSHKSLFGPQCHPIVESSNVTIRTTSQQSTLYITDISADDSGKYTVEVMNDYGVEAAAASVAVEGPRSHQVASPVYRWVQIAWQWPGVVHPTTVAV